jgi:SagB-type dehydrogenase family enzyme
LTTPRALKQRFRRSPFLVVYWKDARLLVHNYARGSVVEVAPHLLSILDACAAWRSVDDLVADLQISVAQARFSVRVLIAQSLLQQSDESPDARDTAMAALSEWNPAAGFFHTTTKKVRFLGRSAARALAKRRSRVRAMPAPVKRLRGAPTVPLPRTDYVGEFPEVLVARRTWRRFGSGPVPLANLATVLALTAGVQQWVPTEFGRLPLKTSPSGGARHPIELYVCVNRVTGLRRGLYHYASDVHRLERVRGGDFTQRLQRWMPHSEYFAKAAFVVVLTAVLDRQVWRYPHARAYRAALAEAGHVCQTFCLTATWLGLAPFCLMGLDDAEIEKDLRIDGVRETVVYVAGAGSRPRGTTWAPRTRGALRAQPNPAFRA